MKFARRVFLFAGIWGLLVVTPLYFAFDLIGQQYPPPLTHPEIFYGFVSVTLVWQIAFLVIASNPIRQRPLMIPAMLEKFVYLVAMLTLFMRGELQWGQLLVDAPDLVWGLLFVAAYLKTSESALAPTPR